MMAWVGQGGSSAGKWKKAMLLFVHQMPLSQWEPNLTKNLRYYLMPKHRGSIVQMNISTELKDLSSTQS